MGLKEKVHPVLMMKSLISGFDCGCTTLYYYIVKMRKQKFVLLLQKSASGSHDEVSCKWAELIVWGLGVRKGSSIT